MLKIGYFADGKWARICLLKILQNPQIQINFIVLRKTKDIKLEKLALRYQIPCYTHIDINSKEFLNELKKYSNDLLVSMSFDQIFKEELLKLYPRKIINCHAGKLPFYRGRNILNWALINDEKEFGISVHFIDKGIDKRKKGDEIINWTQSTREIFNFIRALNTKDLGASAFIDEKEIKIYKSEIYKDKIFNAPIGKIVKKEKNFFIVSTKDGALKITKFKGEVKIGYNFKIYTKNEGGG